MPGAREPALAHRQLLGKAARLPAAPSTALIPAQSRAICSPPCTWSDSPPLAFLAALPDAAGLACGLVAVHRRGRGLEPGRLVERAPAAAGARQARGDRARLRGAHRALEGHLRPPQLDRRQGAGRRQPIPATTRWPGAGRSRSTTGRRMRAGTAIARCWSAPIEGPAAEALIPKIRPPWRAIPTTASGDYSVWPGPNSNSFVAYVLAAIPEAGIALPPTADRQGLAGRAGDLRPHAERHRHPAVARRPVRRHASAGSRAWRSTCWAWWPASTSAVPPSSCRASAASAWAPSPDHGCRL